jgi:hypothetical protein
MFFAAQQRHEKRLQRNHYAISNIFIEIREDRPSRTLSPRPDLPDDQDLGATRFNAGARLYGLRAKIEPNRVNIPSIEGLRCLPAMNPPVTRVYLDCEIVTIRESERHCTVLVGVAEDVQDAQGVVLWNGGHPKTRLKIADHCLRCWLNAFEVLLHVLFPLLRGGTDGELGALARRV